MDDEDKAVLVFLGAIVVSAALTAFGGANLAAYKAPRSGRPGDRGVG